MSVGLWLIVAVAVWVGKKTAEPIFARLGERLADAVFPPGHPVTYRAGRGLARFWACVAPKGSAARASALGLREEISYGEAFGIGRLRPVAAARSLAVPCFKARLGKVLGDLVRVLEAAPTMLSAATVGVPFLLVVGVVGGLGAFPLRGLERLTPSGEVSKALLRFRRWWVLVALLLSVATALVDLAIVGWLLPIGAVGIGSAVWTLSGWLFRGSVIYWYRRGPAVRRARRSAA